MINLRAEYIKNDKNKKENYFKFIEESK